MSCRLSTYVLAMIFLSSCASLQAKREVVDNTFYSSSNPKVQIKVNPELKYIGETKDVRQRQLVDSPYMVIHRSALYVFVDAEGAKAKKAVAIVIERTEASYVSDLYGEVGIFYEKGVSELGGLKFQYCSRLIYPSMKFHLTRFVTDHGYVIPRCIIVKSFSKVYGAQGDIAVTIVYIEAPSGLLHECKDWEPIHPLLPDQKEYLEQFNANCDNAFEVLQ